MTRASFLLCLALSATVVHDAVQGGNPRFKRGDANDDGTFDISDAALLLFHFALGKRP